MPFLLLLALWLPPLAIADSETVTVRHVQDGDSVTLSDQRQVRLIGINAPEFGKDGKADEPLAGTARDRLRDLVQGKRVRLVLEEEQRDHYGRWLAHLRLSDGTKVEEVLLKDGLVSAIAIPPNVHQWKRLFDLETVARSAQRGLWGNAYFAAQPAESLKPTHSGFRFVRGRITHVGRSQKYVYLDMGPQFAVRIHHADWARYFRGQPEDWRGRQIEARGWIREQNGKWRMGIGHPAMLRPLP